jgi:hypothetical protein
MQNKILYLLLLIAEDTPCTCWGRRGRDRIVVGFTTTYVISERETFKKYCQ